MSNCDCKEACEVCDCATTMAADSSLQKVPPSPAVSAEKAAKQLTPMQAIRAKCLDCSGSSKEVRLCTVKTCALMPYRLGHRPVKE